MINFIECINKVNQSERELFKLFKKQIDEEGLRKIHDVSIDTYFVAMAPRSGSSYFMDLLQQTNQLGYPEEYLNTGFVPNISIAVEADNFSDYWVNLVKKRAGKNIFGIKVSFFHLLPLIETGLDEILFNHNKIIFLKRQSLIKQAISLYLANESNVFHTNINHSKDKWDVLNNIPYNNELIKNCIKHISVQETGWVSYLKNKVHLSVCYEDIADSPVESINKVLSFLDKEEMNSTNSTNSIFKKISSDKNIDFYDKFLGKDSNIEYLNELNIDSSRF